MSGSGVGTARTDLVVEQGETWASDTWALVETDANGNAVGLPTDGWTVRGQVRARRASDVVLVQFTSTGANPNAYAEPVSVPLANGTGLPTVGVTLRLSANDTTDLPFATGVYDVFVERAGVVHRIAEGAFRVAQAVTR